MSLSTSDLRYFKRGEIENPKFWERIGGMPDFSGRFVLDVGCGHGSLCLDIANAGASRVVGIDLNRELIEFASGNLGQNYPQLLGKVEFSCIDLRDTEEAETFDCIVSKDSFEHIVELPQMLDSMNKRLKKGGRIYAGFGPLYYSYFGDHRRTKLGIPWAHTIVPERVIVKYLNTFHGHEIGSVRDLGLNMYRLSDYERVFEESGLEVVVFKVNENRHIVSRIFTLIARVPGFREFFSHNIYCILRKGG